MLITVKTKKDEYFKKRDRLNNIALNISFCAVIHLLRANVREKNNILVCFLPMQLILELCLLSHLRGEQLAKG